MSKGVSINRVRIVIFAKAPLPGLAKTRLIPALGEQGAATLARRMLLHTVRQALAANVGPVELCATPSPNAAAWQSLPIPAGVQWSEQGEGDLGMRMSCAAQRASATGEAVLLIGSDCPSLDAAQLRRAAAALQHFDATLVPTADGGYVLLGLNRFELSLFEGIEWSTGGVAAATLERLQRLGWKTQKYATVHDIDEPADLKWVPPRWLESMQDEEPESQLNRI
jgi:rSAM/selenodomain-associated transferase 1